MLHGLPQPDDDLDLREPGDSHAATHGLAELGAHHRDGRPDREQVLHVARLVRLRLTEAEVEAMTGELSSVLGHIEKIGELDLYDVSQDCRQPVLRSTLPVGLLTSWLSTRLAVKR